LLALPRAVHVGKQKPVVQGALSLAVGAKEGKAKVTFELVFPEAVLPQGGVGKGRVVAADGRAVDEADTREVAVDGSPVACVKTARDDAVAVAAPCQGEVKGGEAVFERLVV
jgi:hypothetical protein